MKKDFNMRWVASMVTDMHRILNRGGIFMYPRDSRNPERAGKLRLLYEANPMSMIMEQAGAAATNGHVAIRTIKPTSIHERVAVFLGAAEEVERATAYTTRIDLQFFSERRHYQKSSEGLHRSELFCFESVSSA